jgi:hypothetical protein
MFVRNVEQKKRSPMCQQMRINRLLFPLDMKCKEYPICHHHHCNQRSYHSMNHCQLQIWPTVGKSTHYLGHHHYQQGRWELRQWEGWSMTPMGGHSDIQWEEDPKHNSPRHHYQQGRHSCYHNSRPLWTVLTMNRTRLLQRNLKIKQMRKNLRKSDF